MVKRLRTTSFAGFGAILLVLIVSGMVAAASLLTAITAPEPAPLGPSAVDTTRTFEDVDGDGIDDDCDDAVVADEDAAAAADASVDTNGDGTISVSEAAHSSRVGGVNCNHGGYVGGIADGQCEASDQPAGTEPDTDADAQSGSESCDATDEAQVPTDEQAPADPPAECEATAPAADTAPTDADDASTPKNHGAVVSEVAHSDAVGGKNCNHGGAVSEASHKDNEARKAEGDAAKAERDAAKAAAKAAREAAKGTHGGGKGKNH